MSKTTKAPWVYASVFYKGQTKCALAAGNCIVRVFSKDSDMETEYEHAKEYLGSGLRGSFVRTNNHTVDVLMQAITEKMTEHNVSGHIYKLSSSETKNVLREITGASRCAGIKGSDNDSETHEGGEDEEEKPKAPAKTKAAPKAKAKVESTKDSDAEEEKPKAPAKGKAKAQAKPKVESTKESEDEAPKTPVKGKTKAAAPKAPVKGKGKSKDDADDDVKAKPQVKHTIEISDDEDEE